MHFIRLCLLWTLAELLSLHIYFILSSWIMTISSGSNSDMKSNSESNCWISHQHDSFITRVQITQNICQQDHLCFKYYVQSSVAPFTNGELWNLNITCNKRTLKEHHMGFNNTDNFMFQVSCASGCVVKINFVSLILIRCLLWWCCQSKQIIPLFKMMRCSDQSQIKVSSTQVFCVQMLRVTDNLSEMTLRSMWLVSYLIFIFMASIVEVSSLLRLSLI